MRPKWTFEIEYQSTQQRTKTGWAIIRKDGKAIGKVYAHAAPAMTLAMNNYEYKLEHSGEPA